MTNDAPHPAARDGLPDALRWQLRALRRDVAPERELWAGIAARLEAPAAPPRPVRTPWLALAASLLLVVGVAGLWQARTPGDAMAGAALTEAQRLSQDYRRTLATLPTHAVRPGSLAPALDELDRSAAQIRAALARDPDSRLLLEQLRRTYTRRIELSQRAIVG